MSETLRWGILGTAGIARKNWEAIKNSGKAIVTVVASRDTAKAQEFIAACQEEVPFSQPPRAVGSYEELVAAQDVDAVYVPIPTGLRREWVIKAAEAGKHVMCEKPCAVDAQALEAMTAACAANQVQFMDGVMFVHSDRMAKLREALDDEEKIGEIRRISSAFSFCAPPEFFETNIRVNSALEPAGALGDLGWYTILATLFVMNDEMPQSLRATMLSTASGPDSPEPVPSELSAELFFGNGVSASFYNSFLAENQQWLHVSGSQGSLLVDDFVLPHPGGRVGFVVSNPEFVEEGCKFTMERHLAEYTVAEESNNHESSQETKLFRDFASLALGGTPDPFWPETSLKVQRVLDACLQSARNNGTVVEM